jgi:hypothetical protein
VAAVGGVEFRAQRGRITEGKGSPAAPKFGCSDPALSKSGCSVPVLGTDLPNFLWSGSQRPDFGAGLALGVSFAVLPKDLCHRTYKWEEDAGATWQPSGQ